MSEPLFAHAEDGLADGHVEDGVWPEPGEFVGFVADEIRMIAVYSAKESDVVVEMIGDVAAGGDGVDVEVEDILRDGSNVVDAGFLDGFLQGDVENVGVAVAVTAELEPFIEFAVMREQNAAVGFVDEPGGAGDVAGEMGAFEAIGRRFDEFDDAPVRIDLGRVVGGVAGEFVEEVLAVHEGLCRESTLASFD